MANRDPTSPPPDTTHCPADVAGLVLVDSTAPVSAVATSSTDPAGSDSDSGSRDTLKRFSAQGSVAARLSIGALVGVTSNHFQSTVDEYIHAGSSAQQAAA